MNPDLSAFWAQWNVVEFYRRVMATKETECDLLRLANCHWRSHELQFEFFSLSGKKTSPGRVSQHNYQYFLTTFIRFGINHKGKSEMTEVNCVLPSMGYDKKNLCSLWIPNHRLTHLGWAEWKKGSLNPWVFPKDPKWNWSWSPPNPCVREPCDDPKDAINTGVIWVMGSVRISAIKWVREYMTNLKAFHDWNMATFILKSFDFSIAVGI